jgi:hypothetical protein
VSMSSIKRFISGTKSSTVGTTARVRRSGAANALIALLESVTTVQVSGCSRTATLTALSFIATQLARSNNGVEPRRSVPAKPDHRSPYLPVMSLVHSWPSSITGGQLRTSYSEFARWKNDGELQQESVTSTIRQRRRDARS